MTEKLLSLDETILLSQKLGLPLESHVGIPIRIIDSDGILKIAMEIGQNATARAIRESVSHVQLWRNVLQEYQKEKIAIKLLLNAKKPSNREELLERYSYLNENGVSYKKLAEEFNQLIAGCLRRYNNYRNKKTLSTEEMVDLNLSLVFARNLMLAMSIKDKEINIFIKDGLERLSDGQYPFDDGHPVPRWKMIEVLRTWRNGELHQSVKNTLKKAKSGRKESP